MTVLDSFAPFAASKPQKIELEEGVVEWRLNGVLHREGAPAKFSIDPEGRWYIELWYKQGKLHRLDGPAMVLDSGYFWYKEGKAHRVDGPAVVRYTYKNQLQQLPIEEWCYEGVGHRVGGPATTFINGKKIWVQHGKVHREDGPAIIRVNGSQEWYQNDLLHREDGPAIIKANGRKEWWIRGKRQKVTPRLK